MSFDEIPDHLVHRGNVRDTERLQLSDIGANYDYTYKNGVIEPYPAKMGSFNTWIFDKEPFKKLPAYGKVVLGNFVSSILAGFLFLLIATWSAIRQCEFGGDVINVAFTQGIGVWAILVLLRNVSADFNPIVTIYEAFLPHFRSGVKSSALLKTVFLVVAVVVGSFLGSLLGSLVGGVFDPSEMCFKGTPTVNTAAGVNAGAAFLVESLGFLIWMWAYLVAYQDRHRTEIPNPDAFLGFLWTALVLLGYNYTGASYNPWRHLAPAIISACFGAPVFGQPAGEHAWVYYIGPLVGGLITAVWFFVQRNSRSAETEKEKQ